MASISMQHLQARDCQASYRCSTDGAGLQAGARRLETWPWRKQGTRNSQLQTERTRLHRLRRNGCAATCRCDCTKQNRTSTESYIDVHALPPIRPHFLMISHKYFGLSPQMYTVKDLGGGRCCTRNRHTTARTMDANCWQEIKNHKHIKAFKRSPATLNIFSVPDLCFFVVSVYSFCSFCFRCGRLAICKIWHQQLRNKCDAWQNGAVFGLWTLVDGGPWSMVVAGVQKSKPPPHGSSQGPSTQGYTGANQEHRIEIQHLQLAACVQLSTKHVIDDASVDESSNFFELLSTFLQVVLGTLLRHADLGRRNLSFSDVIVNALSTKARPSKKGVTWVPWSLLTS